jgi:hypothetical protein
MTTLVQNDDCSNLIIEVEEEAEAPVEAREAFELAEPDVGFEELPVVALATGI